MHKQGITRLGIQRLPGVPAQFYFHHLRWPAQCFQFQCYRAAKHAACAQFDGQVGAVAGGFAQVRLMGAQVKGEFTIRAGAFGGKAQLRVACLPATAVVVTLQCIDVSQEIENETAGRLLARSLPKGVVTFSSNERFRDADVLQPK